MKALNVVVRETPVGLVACLPPDDPTDWAMTLIFWEPDPLVLGVVTKCERCGGTGRYGIVGPPCGHCHDDVDARLFGGGVKSGTGYAPLKFVKVLAVLPITAAPHKVAGDFIAIDAAGNATLWLWDEVDEGRDGIPLNLPDAEPGGVALHVEWTGCPYCGSGDPDNMYVTDTCPTCRTPPTVEGDGPIVEVAP